MVVGQFSQDVDILVIGGGPAGYTAAFRAAELGKTVAIVDPKESLGGECLHAACIPSKSAVFQVESLKAIEALSKGLEQRCSSLGIERLYGFAHFENTKTAQITGETVSVVKFRKAIVASGTQQRTHADYPDATQVEDVYTSEWQNKKVLIVGDTPSAIEASTCLSQKNTVSLWADGPLLPTFQTQLVKVVQRSLAKHISILTEKPLAHDFDIVVLAGHRAPQTDSLQLKNANIDFSPSGIPINDSCKTSNPKVFAIGECADCQHSAALAITQGRVAAEAACGLNAHVDAQFIPQVAWSSPEIAQCGSFDTANMVSIKWGNSGLAVALGCQDGITLLAFDKDSQAVTGIGIVGSGATEMISEGVLALEMGATLYDLATIVRPHPTKSEMLSEAASAALSSLI